MSIEEILDHCDASPARHIVITGGEPTLQLEELHKLVKVLRVADYRVALETNGTNIVDMKLFDHVTVSPKEKVSMVHKNQEKNRAVVMSECSDLKIIDEGQTLEELMEWKKRIWAHNGYYLQPLSNSPESITRCAHLIAGQCFWKLSLQQHKIAGLK